MKFSVSRVTFLECPGECALAFSITGCPRLCDGCSSPELRENIGIPLTLEIVKEEIKKNGNFITAVLFLGGDQFTELYLLAKEIRLLGLKTALYSGSDCISEQMMDCFDYVKIGPYLRDFGPLTSKDTNQKFFKVGKNGFLEDRTREFQTLCL